MNWIKKAIALPQLTDILLSAAVGEIDWMPSAAPEPKDISVELALNALVANGILIKNVTQNTSYSYEGLELDLSMTILVEPKKGKATLESLNDWFFSKKGW